MNSPVHNFRAERKCYYDKPMGIYSEELRERCLRMTLAEQMGNIGSEVHRARIAKDRNEQRFLAARDRALELFKMTLGDSRWRGRLREIARVRSLL